MAGIEFLQSILEDTPFTQKQIADYMGVDQSMISHWKKGTRSITSAEFEKLLGFLGYSLLDYLNNTRRPISFAFSASKLSEEDILTLGWLNKVMANLEYMETLSSDESRN